MTRARRLERPGNIRWKITVRPSSDAAERSPVLYALGLAAIVLVRAGKARYRDTAAVLLGLTLIVLGLILVKESGESLAEQPWFLGALEISTGTRQSRDARHRALTAFSMAAVASW